MRKQLEIRMSSLSWKYRTRQILDRKSLARHNLVMKMLRNRQSGFGYVEYMVTTMGVLFLLFAPLPGQGGDTVVDYAMNAIRAFGQNSSLLLSLP